MADCRAAIRDPALRHPNAVVGGSWLGGRGDLAAEPGTYAPAVQAIVGPQAPTLGAGLDAHLFKCATNCANDDSEIGPWDRIEP